MYRITGSGIKDGKCMIKSWWFTTIEVELCHIDLLDDYAKHLIEGGLDNVCIAISGNNGKIIDSVKY